MLEGAMNAAAYDDTRTCQAGPAGPAGHRGYVGDATSRVSHEAGHGAADRLARPLESHRSTWWREVQPDSFERRHPVLFGALCTVAACAVFFGWPYFMYAIIRLFS